MTSSERAPVIEDAKKLSRTLARDRLINYKKFIKRTNLPELESRSGVNNIWHNDRLPNLRGASYRRSLEARMKNRIEKGEIMTRLKELIPEEIYVNAHMSEKGYDKFMSDDYNAFGLGHYYENELYFKKNEDGKGIFELSVTTSWVTKEEEEKVFKGIFKKLPPVLAGKKIKRYMKANDRVIVKFRRRITFDVSEIGTLYPHGRLAKQLEKEIYTEFGTNDVIDLVLVEEAFKDYSYGRVPDEAMLAYLLSKKNLSPEQQQIVLSFKQKDSRKGAKSKSFRAKKVAKKKKVKSIKKSKKIQKKSGKARNIRKDNQETIRRYR